jgi:hypothetical protein
LFNQIGVDVPNIPRNTSLFGKVELSSSCDVIHSELKNAVLNFFAAGESGARIEKDIG